jgi:hypothetical protein
MCLDIITKNGGFDPDKEVIAYKVFEINSNNQLISPNFGQIPFIKGRWLNEKPYRKFYCDDDLIESFWDSNICYKIGFHAFKNEEDASNYKKYLNEEYNRPDIKYCVLKVKLKKVVAKGTQKFWIPPSDSVEAKVIVAKDLFIM